MLVCLWSVKIRCRSDALDAARSNAENQLQVSMVEKLVLRVCVCSVREDKTPVRCASNAENQLPAFFFLSIVLCFCACVCVRMRITDISIIIFFLF